MNFPSFFIVLVIALSLGCTGKNSSSGLRTETEMLRQEIEQLKKEREEEQKKTEKNYQELRERLDKLETLLFSSSTKSPDALYSIAESYYTKGNFKEAILGFQRFIDAYPNDRRTPVSYLKQGISLIKIGKKEEAKFFFQTVTDKFPDSEEAKRARERLKDY